MLGRSIVRAQIAAAASARALARGEQVPILRSYIAEVGDLGAALRDAAEILDQRIRERDAAAEALSRAKDNFIATVSHELRTPLNAIYGWVAMLRTGTLDPARQQHALQVIERNARAQSQVVEDLLDMSSIVHGRLRLATEPVDLAAVVRTAIDLITPAAGERQTSIIGARCRPTGHGHRRSGPAAADRLEPGRQCAEVHSPGGQNRSHDHHRRRSSGRDCFTTTARGSRRNFCRTCSIGSVRRPNS